MPFVFSKRLMADLSGLGEQLSKNVFGVSEQLVLSACRMTLRITQYSQRNALRFKDLGIFRAFRPGLAQPLL